MAIRQHTSTGSVIDALGGTSATARLTGRSMQSVTNWRAAGRFPPDTFLILSAALRDIGAGAPSTLWGIKPAPKTSPSLAST